MAAASTSKSSNKSNTSSYFNSLTSETKQRYQSKLLYDSGTKSLPDPYCISEKWSADPNTWPDLTFGDIYLYLIDTPSIYTKESMKAYKSLEAYKYVVSGHVHAVLSHPVNDSCPFIAMKTKVTPSQRARDKPHESWVYLDKNSGAVYCAHCTCMAGLGEVCSHVGALLFKIEMGVKIGMTQTSSTSKACQWNNAFRKEVTPATVTEIFDQIKGRRKKEVPSVQATGSTPLAPADVLIELHSLIPDASFFTSVSIPGITDTQSIPLNQQPDKYPGLLTSLSESVVGDSDLETQCGNIFDSYKVTESQAHKLEMATRNQAVSPLWYQHRMGRVTASKAHDVFTRRESTPPDNLVKRIVGYTSYDISKKEAVKWGIEHEEECRLAYTTHQSTGHLNFSCKRSGFCVNPEYPFLGASPDGTVNCDCCGKGTLEIKCPFIHRDKSVQEAASVDKNFCLDASLHLKTSHRYYTQVQMQMFLTNCNYCDFVVYNKCRPSPSMVIIRLGMDQDFCNKLINKCENFIRDHIIKELVTHQLENKTTGGESLDNTNVETWCLCSEPEYGRMVKCDNDNCPYQWFHYKCVNIRRKPAGNWYCASCDN